MGVWEYASCLKPPASYFLPPALLSLKFPGDFLSRCKNPLHIGCAELGCI